MNSSIFDQLFKIKYGNRSEGYDVENTFPKWDVNFDKLLDDLKSRKERSERVMKNYAAIQTRNSFNHDIMDSIIEVFEEIRKARFSEPLECIIAQETLMLVYGIKILINLLPFVKTEDDASKFYKFYCTLHEIVLGISETYKNDKRNFWHKYSFKVGLHLLALAVKAKEYRNEFFEVDNNYGLYFKNHYGRGTNPLYFILSSVVNLPRTEPNHFVEDFLNNEVRKIIEKGIKK